MLEPTSMIPMVGPGPAPGAQGAQVMYCVIKVAMSFCGCSAS